MGSKIVVGSEPRNSNFVEGVLIDAEKTGYGTAKLRLMKRDEIRLKTRAEYEIEMSGWSGFLGRYSEQFTEDFYTRVTSNLDEGEYPAEIASRLLRSKERNGGVRFYFNLEETTRIMKNS